MSFLVVLEFPAPMNKWQLIVFSMLQVWANKPKFRFLMTAKLLLDDFFGRNATVQYCRPFVLRDVMKIQIDGIRNPKIGRRGVDDKSSFCTLFAVIKGSLRGVESEKKIAHTIAFLPQRPHRPREGALSACRPQNAALEKIH